MTFPICSARQMDDIWVVSSHFSEDLEWLSSSPHPVVVVSKRPESLDHGKFKAVHGIPNKGREFGSYLWFICNYWNELPDKVAFIHGHEKSHHQFVDLFDVISRHRSESFLGLNGPRNAAYHYFFSDMDHYFFGSRRRAEDSWNLMGLGRICNCPSQLVFQGGTQTLISKDLIKSNPLSFYEGILNFLMSLSDSGFNAGLVLEMAWHVIMDQPPIIKDLFHFEFHAHCMDRRASVLLLAPGMVWASHMASTVKFPEQESDEGWIRTCLSHLRM